MKELYPDFTDYFGQHPRTWRGLSPIDLFYTELYIKIDYFTPERRNKYFFADSFYGEYFNIYEIEKLSKEEKNILESNLKLYHKLNKR